MATDVCCGSVLIFSGCFASSKQKCYYRTGLARSWNLSLHKRNRMCWIDLLSHLVIINRKKCRLGCLWPDRFPLMRHVWSRRDLSLSVKGRVCTASVWFVLVHNSKTWPSRADRRRPLLSECRFLHHIGRIRWESFVDVSDVRRKVLTLRVHSLDKVLNQKRFKW